MFLRIMDTIDDTLSNKLGTLGAELCGLAFTLSVAAIVCYLLDLIS